MTKRFLSLLLCAAILLSAPSALAASKKKKKVEPEPEPPKVVAAYQMVSGTVKSLNNGAKTIEIDLGGEQGSIVLLMGKTPYIIDNTKRAALAFSKVKAGMTVRAWHSNAVTSSLPPQSACLAMAVNVDATSAPDFMEVEQVFRSGSTYTLLNQPQDVRLSLTTSAKITAFKRGDSNKVTALKPGARLLYWADTVAESYPAQVGTKSVLMLPYPYAGYILMEKGFLNVNGHMLENKAIIEEDGTVFIPGAEACKRLDLSPNYVKSTQTLRIKISSRLSTELTAGKTTFVLGKETIAIPAPKVVDYVLYIPMEAVLQFESYKYVANA